jgi:hypothetical protein
MKLRSMSARVAFAGATTALIAGGLVAATNTAAHAETGVAQYNCTNPVTTDVIPVAVSIGADLSGLPPLPTGFEAPAGSLPVDVSLTVPEQVVAALKANGINSIGLSGSDVKLPFGNAQVPLTGVEADPVALPDSGDLVFPFQDNGSTTVTNGSFKLPDPGTQDVKMPASFTTTADTNLIPLPLTCTINGEQSTITSLTVIKQGSTLTATAPKSIKKGKTLKIAAKVAGANVPATGKVVAKEGKKVLGTGALKSGKATISVKKLKPGTHNIVLSYAGDKRTNASNTYGVIVKVKK